MAFLDRQMIEELSQKTSFQMDVLEKAYRLIELLREIYRTAELKDVLVLKGGTAINFLYFDFPRLSVDIDVDYIGSVQKEDMLKEREILEGILERTFRTLDYEINKNSSYALSSYDLYYQNSAGNRDRIQVEINFLKRVTILEEIRKDFSPLFFFEGFKILTLQPEELFGRKLTTLVKRATARDLYDIYRLLESEIEFNRKALRFCFIFSYCLNEDPRRASLEAFDDLSDYDVRRSLLPLLRKSERIELANMKGKVRPILKDFLSFTKSEKEFISKLFDKKEYKPKLLFEDVEFNPAVKEHPGIKWRLKNL